MVLVSEGELNPDHLREFRLALATAAECRNIPSDLGLSRVGVLVGIIRCCRVSVHADCPR
jgi:hypothetical protein